MARFGTKLLVRTKRIGYGQPAPEFSIMVARAINAVPAAWGDN
ncbi:MAG: hypothetical protein ACXABY_17300 [Candidatus Thorarchaeota archaeon]